MNRKVTYLMLALLIVQACEKSPDEQVLPDESFSTEVSDKEGFSVKGMVFADGRPAAGVVVSDGRNVTMTDFDGRYWLRTSNEDDIVWVSIPSGYEVGTENGWEPQFWARLDSAKIASGQVQRHDFFLKSAEQDNFRLIAFSDTHVRGTVAPQGISEMDSVIFTTKFIPHLLSQARATDRKVYAVVLGDMVQDSYVTSMKTGLPEYKKCLRDVDFPVFHLPGNHDYDGVQYEVHVDEEARKAKKYYRDHLGPTYYSFNIGTNHFVMLDGTQMTGGGFNKYISRITARQYEWLKKDLERVEDKNGTALVICCHQPFYMHNNGLNQGVGSIRKSNRDSVMALTTAFSKVTILSGHQHYSDIFSFTNGTSEVRQYTHTAVAGPSYRSRLCSDGSPCGLTVYDFAGSGFTRRMSGYDPEVDFQVKTYSEENRFVLNIPAYEDGWSVMVLENGVRVKEAERVVRTDPDYEKEATENKFSSGYGAVMSSHIFEYMPKDRDALVKMVIKDGKEENYTEEIKLQ